MNKLFYISNKIILTLLLISFTTELFCQSPEKFSYQAIIRDNDNVLLSGQTVGIRLSILQSSETGSSVYVETQVPTTNSNGLMSIEIGGSAATIISGNLSTIDWSAGPYYLKTEVDPAGGSDYSITSVNQLLSVPYALYANTVGNADDDDADPSNELQDISLEDTKLSISMGSTVDLGVLQDGYEANTDDQNLSISGNNLSIEDGNTVTLPSGNSLWDSLSGNVYYSGGHVGIGTDVPYSLLSVGVAGQPDNAITCLGLNGIFSVGTASYGTGVYGLAADTSYDINYGGYFQANGIYGKGVYGYATYSDNGSNYGGHFRSDGMNGRGVYGIAASDSNTVNYGGYFLANGSEGRGVLGTSPGPNGYGVYGHASNTGDYTNFGGYFIANGTTGRGIEAMATGASGRGVYGNASYSGDATNFGGYFVASGSTSRGVYAVSTGATGRGIHAYATYAGNASNYGGYFVAGGQTGRAVYGEALSSSDNTNYGGYFKANGVNGRGVYSYTFGTSGIAVYGFASGSNGTALFGYATGTSGRGVYGYGNLYDFYAAGPGTNYGSASSIRWKNNITPIDSVLFKLKNLRGVYFTWDEEHGGERDFGFIAEEVGKYFPECVAFDPEDPEYADGMDYGKMTPVLLQAIKEQQVLIEELTKRIEALESK